MKQIKTISDGGSEDFDRKVNDELKKIEKSGSKVVDIKFSTDIEVDDSYFNAMIIYEKQYVYKAKIPII